MPFVTNTIIMNVCTAGATYQGSGLGDMVQKIVDNDVDLDVSQSGATFCVNITQNRQCKLSRRARLIPTRPLIRELRTHTGHGK